MHGMHVLFMKIDFRQNSAIWTQPMRIHVQKCTQLDTSTIRNLAYFDSHMCLSKYATLPITLTADARSLQKFVPLKLEICLNYAYSLDLCCYNIV